MSSQVCKALHEKQGSGCAIRVGTLDAELEPLVLSKAAQHGLDPAWVARLAKLDPQRRQVSLLAGLRNQTLMTHLKKACALLEHAQFCMVCQETQII